MSTGILVAVNGYILTTVDFVKRTLSDIKIVRGIKIADFKKFHGAGLSDS